MSDNGTTEQAVDIPGFIALVADQVRAAIDRFKASGQTPLLYLNGIQLQIAFTAEESGSTEGGINLKPWIISVSGKGKEASSSSIAHIVTLNLMAEVQPELPPPIQLRNLGEEDFGLLLDVVRFLRENQHATVFNGPDTELVPPFVHTWRSHVFSVEIRRRLAKSLLQNIDSLNTLKDVESFYPEALNDLIFAPLGAASQPPSLQQKPPGVAFR